MLQDVVNHINHIRAVAGVQHVGIGVILLPAFTMTPSLGGDYCGIDRTPVGLEDVSHYPEVSSRSNDISSKPHNTPGVRCSHRRWYLRVD